MHLRTSSHEENSRGGQYLLGAEPKLLLVDDEKSVLTSLAALLRFARPDCNIGMASSAEEALKILEQTQVDLIVTDLKLPAMDGLSLIKTALARYPETRSILMTAYGTDSIDYGAYRGGCVCYLEKPFDVERLLLVIDETLSERAIRASNSAEELGQAVLDSSSSKTARSIRICAEGRSGIVIVEKSLITYADFAGFVGINALVAQLGCKASSITCEESASQISNVDLPVACDSFLIAAKRETTAEQISILRGSGRQLRTKPSEEYPEDPREETVIREQMGSEILQRLREIRLDATTDGRIKGKRLPFHRPLSSEVMSKEVQLRNLVNVGIDHYRIGNWVEARRSWKQALELDSNCRQARRNLRALNQTVNATDSDE